MLRALKNEYIISPQLEKRVEDFLYGINDRDLYRRTNRAKGDLDFESVTCVRG